MKARYLRTVPVIQKCKIDIEIQHVQFPQFQGAVDNSVYEPTPDDFGSIPADTRLVLQSVYGSRKLRLTGAEKPT